MTALEIEKILYALRRPVMGIFDLPKYLGTPRTVWNVSSADKKRVVRAWLKSETEITVSQVKKIIGDLLKSKTFDARTVPGIIILRHKDLRIKITPADLARWLSCVAGWAEIDSLCQSAFGAEDFLPRWTDWQTALEKFARDINVAKRRASLVLLTRAVRENADLKFSKLAFQNILTLRAERDILITKAISWLLRSLIKNHRKEVIEFIEKHKEELPAIAVRETLQKIKTGKKTKKKK